MLRSLVKQYELGSYHQLPFLGKKHGRLYAHMKMEDTPICKAYFQSYATYYKNHCTWVLIWSLSFVS